MAAWTKKGSVKGPAGAKGDTGATGATPSITVTATVDSTAGTPSVSVTKGGTAAAPTFALAFKGLKGAKGDQGAQATTAQCFLAAHPVGSLYAETTGKNPGAAYGGTWSMQPSTDGYLWKREA